MRLVIIDGNAIVHRAYHALPSLRNRNGELLNAVYGFCTMFLRIINELKPEFFVVVFDTPKTTFRHKEFIGYQANRPVTDPELATQFGRVREFLVAMGIRVFEREGYEADDIIGTISTKVVKNEGDKIKEVIIVTGDRDLFQLVNRKVKIYMPIRGVSEGQIFDEEGVKKRMGIKPNQIVDYKALVGDASDNYPGVSGVGPKTAINLLEEFGSLKGIYENIKKVEKDFGENLSLKLTEGQESANLSQKLAQIFLDVPLEWNLDEWKITSIQKNEEKVINKLREFGFKSLIERFSGKDEKEDKKEIQKKSDNKKQLNLL